MNKECYTDSSGIIRYYTNGYRHREDGPAVIYPKSELLMWYKNDLLHREDGPAILDKHGDDARFIKGKKINCSSQEEFERLMKLKAFW